MPESVHFAWTHPGLTLSFTVEDGRLGLERLEAPGVRLEPPATAPVVEILDASGGRGWSGSRNADTVASQKLRYESHTIRAEGDASMLEVHLADEEGLRVRVEYRSFPPLPAFQTRVTVANSGATPRGILAITSFTARIGLVRRRLAELSAHWAENEWLGEARWRQATLDDLLPDLDLDLHGYDPRGRIERSAHGTWPSAEFLPMGALVDSAEGWALGWQLEGAAPWQWEIGESREGLHLALLGPNDSTHQAALVLGHGQSFTTVPVSVAVTDGGFSDVIGVLTQHRRRLRRTKEQVLSIVFNDYMNTIMGDPTTAKLLPLIRAAGEVGAEYFCVDAGWYDDSGGHWWDAVGEWRPSRTRFPGGIDQVFEAIRDAGMVPGIWLEPEVVGVKSEMAARLPEEAFFARFGQRIVEHGRYHLDFRHSAARAHLDEVVDRLVSEHRIGYLKLDYNINGGPGTDRGGSSPGLGLLGHVRAYQEWLDGLLERHPGLVLENCASGGMRMDYGLLTRTHLQSVSDQQDMARLAAIAAAAPTAVLPEQAGIWAYPQPEHRRDQLVFTLVSAMLGRMHLSGHLDRMSADQQSLVRAALEAYRSLRGELATAIPFWPAGPPRWDDDWLSMGLQAPDRSYLTVWGRGASAAWELPMTPGVNVRQVFPSSEDSTLRWSRRVDQLRVERMAPLGAAVFALEPCRTAPAHSRPGPVGGPR